MSDSSSNAPAVIIDADNACCFEKGAEMNVAQKKRPATSAGRRSESDPGETENRDVSGFANRKKNEAGSSTKGGKPVHISQKEAQSIPVDRDPDDPVSR